VFVSRACLGKRIIFSIKWRQKEAFFAPTVDGTVNFSVASAVFPPVKNSIS
jgi:hypothetical protein